ncbi:hypothetical protein LINPERHAP1_LOCUS17606 [Linum perenne]
MYSTAMPFMHVRVCLDVTKPLKKEKKVRKPGGEWLMAKFRYERLSAFCYVCGRLGHIKRHCHLCYRLPAHEIVRGWDAKLRAEYKRPVVLGSKQWLRPATKFSGKGGTLSNRAPLGQLAPSNLMERGFVPMNMHALLSNLGVGGGLLEMERSVEEQENRDEMEGIEVGEDRKRCRHYDVEGSKFKLLE